MTMKRIFIFISLLVSFACMHAQSYANRTVSDADDVVVRSRAIMSSGSMYSSRVYEPFSNSAPSEYTASTSAAHAPGGPRRLGGGTDPGSQSEQSPIGEPWILLAFAIAFGGIIAYRKKRTL